MLHAHINNDYLTAPRDTIPIERVRRGAGLVMSGDKGDRLVHIAVGDGNARVGQTADTRRYTGNDTHRDAMLHQGLRFFAATAKDEGITTFEA